jgi:hypothetical protein
MVVHNRLIDHKLSKSIQSERVKRIRMGVDGSSGVCFYFFYVNETRANISLGLKVNDSMTSMTI